MIGAMAWAGLSGHALACSLIVPAPGPGETMETVVNRIEHRTQRNLRDRADHVYLARVVGEAGQSAYFNPLVALKGDRPGRRAPATARDSCEPSTPALGELRIVFAHRTTVTEMPWRPWRWGQLVVLATRRPDEVRDPELAVLLRRAAERISND